MEDTGLVLTNIEIMFLLISFRIMKGMKGRDCVAGYLSFNGQNFGKLENLILSVSLSVCVAWWFQWAAAQSGSLLTRFLFSSQSFSISSPFT